MKPSKVFLVSSLLLVICLASLFALRRRPNQVSSDQAGPRILWSYTPGPSPLSGIALAPNGTIHFAAADGIYALSPAGHLLWRSPLPSGPVFAAPTLAPSGTLYAASQSGKLFALDTSGNLIWQSAALPHKFFTPPALGTGDTLYVADDYADLFAFAPSLGPDFTWKQMTYSPTGSRDDILLGMNYAGDGSFRSSPVIGSDDLVYLAHQSFLYRLNLHGDVVWYLHLAAWQLGFSAIGGDGMVYLEGHAPPWLFAVGHDGRQRWTLGLADRLRGSPVVDNSGVIYVCDTVFLRAILSDRQSKWRVQADCNSGPVLAADGTLYLGTNAHQLAQGPRPSFLAAFAPDGQLKWKIEIQGMVRDAPAIAPDGTIFVTTDKGFAYALSDASSPPMDSPWPRFQHDAQNSGRSRF
jgi:outer membrane protein assembly factor BamB